MKKPYFSPVLLIGGGDDDDEYGDTHSQGGHGGNASNSQNSNNALDFTPEDMLG